MPRGEVDRFELENTRDFSGSPLHRYRRRSVRDAVPPSPLLQVSGIPMDLQRNENALGDLFARHGFVKSVQFVQKNKMAVIEMGTLDEAIMALVNIDNAAFPGSNMRVAFAVPFQGGGGLGGPSGPGGPGGPGGPPLSMGNRPRDRSLDRGRDRGGDRGRDRGPPLDRDRPFRGRDRGRDRNMGRRF